MAYPRRNRYRWIIGLIVLLLIAFSNGVLLGHYFGAEQSRQAAAEKTKWLEEIEAVRIENAELMEKIVILESSSKVDRLAVLEAQNVLAKMQEKLSEAKQEVDLYRRIGSSEKREETLTVQDFKIIRNGGLRYRLTLSQGVGQEREITGRVEIAITGRMNGEKHVLSLKDFDKEHGRGLIFSFQYYQLLSGTILWPEKFVPESVEVQVNSQTPGISNVTKRWAWDEVTKD